jgi:hypothetical protein
MTKEEFELTSIHEIIHSITVFAFERMYDKNNKLLPKSEWESLPDNVTQSILKLDATRRALNYKFRQVDSFKEAFKKLDETKDLKRYAPSNKYEKFVYALVNNKEFIAEMFTSNDFMNLLNQVPAPSGNSFYTEILNILKRLIGLDVKDDIDTVFVGRVGMQVIEELNKFKQLGKSASNKQSNLDIKFAEELSLFNKLLDKGPTIIPVKQPAQQSKQTDIIDVIEKSNQIENVTDFEGRVGLLKLNKTDEGMPFVTFHVDGKRVNKISFTSFKRDQEAFKQAIRDEYKLPSEYESFSVGELNIYELSDNEQKLLIKRFGADAMGAYNNLSESEKESIIECLK